MTGIVEYQDFLDEKLIELTNTLDTPVESFFDHPQGVFNGAETSRHQWFDQSSRLGQELVSKMLLDMVCQKSCGINCVVIATMKIGCTSQSNRLLNGRKATFLHLIDYFSIHRPTLRSRREPLLYGQADNINTYESVFMRCSHGR